MTTDLQEFANAAVDAMIAAAAAEDPSVMALVLQENYTQCQLEAQLRLSELTEAVLRNTSQEQINEARLRYIQAEAVVAEFEMRLN